VDHPLPSLEAARPWRTATLVVSLIAGLELVVIVGAGVAVFGRSVAHKVQKAAIARAYAPAKTTAQPIDAPAGTASLPRAETVVTILNGGHVAGAAAIQAEKVRGLGYMIGQVGNSPRSAQRTVVEYRAGYRPEAARLARELGVRVISPLDGLRPSDLLGAHVALILGT